MIPAAVPVGWEALRVPLREFGEEAKGVLWAVADHVPCEVPELVSLGVAPVRPRRAEDQGGFVVRFLPELRVAEGSAKLDNVEVATV
jgi:hypothetical protein